MHLLTASFGFFNSTYMHINWDMVNCQAEPHLKWDLNIEPLGLEVVATMTTFKKHYDLLCKLIFQTNDVLRS